ncbi:MAG: hypothetical protein HC892_04865 [Saprospiraceae bacterium]|nr:hypothetical protein [Saprospiraceae bacterium]
MKNIGLIVIGLFLGLQVNAQGYDSAFGLRLGTEWGLTFQQRIAKRTTLEAIIQSSFRQDETTITLLGEQHYPILMRNFNVYLGGGLHKGWVTSGSESDYSDPFGVTLIGGAEIALGKLNLSWDFKPSINVVGGDSPIYAHTGISLRYVIDKRELINNEKNPEKRARQKERAKRKRQKEREKRKEDGNTINWKFWEKWTN